MSLLSLPLELRFEVYSYLLLTKNVSQYDLDGKVRTEYATSLFRVNKEISAEALHYFYSENAFSIVEFHTLESGLEEYLCHYLPFKSVMEDKKLPRWLREEKFPLRAMFRYRKIRYGAKGVVLIVPSLELDRLILLLNLQHRNSFKSGLAVTAVLHFRLDTPSFKHKASTTERLLGCLLLLRRCTNEVDRARFNVILQGSFNQKVATALRTETLGPFSQEERASRNQTALESANRLRESGLCREAINETQFVRMLTLGRYFFPFPDATDPFWTLFEDTAVGAALTKSMCYVDLGEPLKAAPPIHESAYISYQSSRAYMRLHGEWTLDYFNGRKLFPIDPFKEPIELVLKNLQLFKPTTREETRELNLKSTSLHDLRRKLNEKKEKFRNQYPQCLPDPRTASFQIGN